MADIPRTVWILGAGFSKPLGGPLLTELFSLESKQYVEYTLRRMDGSKFSVLSESPAADIHQAYEHGGRSGTLREPRWRHAEDFLAKLDSASQEAGQRDESVRRIVADLVGQASTRLAKGLVTPSDHQDELGNICDDRLREISIAAKRWFAAECSAFVANAVVDTEIWKPYRQWAKYLERHGKRDSIISYNYDRVLETLNSNNIFSIRRPFALRSANPAVYKVHGSVDWVQSGPEKVGTSDDPFHAVHCPEREMALCTPGPSKAKAYKEWREFIDEAYARIEEADRVFFLGYRAPETDTLSLQSILNAIANNKKQPKVGIVLGLGGDSAPHAERLVELLSFVNRDASVKRLHMFAQDFLAVYTTNANSVKDFWG